MITSIQWEHRPGMVECHETQITTKWPEYIRGVVIAQDTRRAEGTFTAYVEYFKYGVARQMWAGYVFPDSDHAKTWCEHEMQVRLEP